MNKIPQSSPCAWQDCNDRPRMRPGVQVIYCKMTANVEMAMDVVTVEGTKNETVSFPALRDQQLGDSEQVRKIIIPQNRLTPLRDAWMKIYTPVVQHMKLQIRFSPKSRTVELRNCALTTETASLQKSADFVRAFALGFSVDDALVLLRLDDMYVDSFEVKDVKTLNGDHLARAIGRLAGRNGKTKNTIENTSRTRIVLADSKIHILGSYRNIRVAKDALVSLILGSTPGTVYTRLRNVAARLAERRF